MRMTSMNSEISRLFDLHGRRALVTGSGRGIGREIALTLGRAGAEILFHATGENATLNEAVETARKEGIACRALTAELSRPEELPGLISEAGEIDILVLNASVQKYQTVPEFREEDFDWQFQVNVSASFRLIEGFLRGMRERKWGRVLAVGSVNQWKQSPRLAVYAATKSALSNLIKNCARNYAAEGITFNCLAPGVIATDRNREALSDHTLVETLLQGIPAKRIGTPADCAGTALLLCSDAGSYITGTDIPVAGGMQL